MPFNNHRITIRLKLWSSLASLPFVCNGKVIWSSSPATAEDIVRTAYPLGNGRLGAMPFGPAGSETLNLNIDSLWSGGPYEISNYTGGNPTEPVASSLDGIRDWIFTNGTGNVTKLLGDDSHYGSYRVLGNLSISFPQIQKSNSTIREYSRVLDLKTGVHTTQYAVDSAKFKSQTFCSFPDQVCVYLVNSTHALPPIEIQLDNALADSATRNATCEDGHVRLQGVTQLGPPQGMQYDAIAQVQTDFPVKTTCRGSTLHVSAQNQTNRIAIVISAATNFDATRGTAESNYSFRGKDPGPVVEHYLSAAVATPILELWNRHLSDFNELTDRFVLSLPDVLGSSDVETASLIARYSANNSKGDPYLESLLFDYATYLFVSSSRPGSLPPNLQGRWSNGLYAAWSGDYHANINLQMNHWTPDQTGLTDLQAPLWDYMKNTWFPRGSETAQLLYNAPGWVVHDEMNVFGHTGMKSGASWANYPAAAAWMMQHVWDHWEYSQDVDWLQAQGYPMLKDVARFWISQLQEDVFSKDETLVVNPCNSPEHGPTTFGCAHYQQLVHQVFEAVLSATKVVTDPDTAFLSNVTTSLSRLDRGFHVGSWGQIKEWKLPDSFGYELMNDTHRHLSELVGWYPGYSLSSFLKGYVNQTVQQAVEQKLYSRGDGNAPDANAGWAKLWRAACWARLNNTELAHHELRYAISENFVGNGFSMYSGENMPFQIDANFGLGGAILSMLIVDLPNSFSESAKRNIILGPAIPAAWGGGSVSGLRLRGGGAVDFRWDEEGIVQNVTRTTASASITFINKKGKPLLLDKL